MTIDRSAKVLRRRAANMPAAMASGMVITRARAASLADRPSAGQSSSVTGTRYWKDSPQSNVTTFFSSRPYWVRSGSSVPSSSLSASTVSWEANGPSTLRPTSPGNTLTIRKTIVASRNSVRTERATRRMMYRAMLPF